MGHHNGVVGDSEYGGQGETWCWVDGSLKEGKVGGAVFFGWKSPHNAIFRVVGTQSSYNTELQAVEIAQHNAPVGSGLHVFLDNKVVCSVVERLAAAPAWFMLPPTQSKIVDSLRRRTVQGWDTSIMHVYSHARRHPSIL